MLDYKTLQWACRQASKCWLLKQFFLVYLLSSFFASGQSTITGTVTDSLGMIIPMASVLLHNQSSNTLEAYTFTDDSGAFSLVVHKAGSYQLSANSMSFKKVTRSIDIPADNATAISQNFTLSKEIFQLQEVEVNANIPILRKKDTIIIRTDSYVDGTEEVVEDVLKKLPGIDVSEDGTVSVQGQIVDKVMVEGDDLFESGYKLLTKNLHAGVVDKVEILEHFSDNPLLKDINDSEKVALNLLLKEDQKSSFFGNAKLGYGTDSFYDAKLNLISFNKKTKYYLFSNLNNTGYDATGDIYQLIYPDFFTNPDYVGDGESAFRFINIENISPELKKARYNFNNAELISVNGIYNPTKELKLKGLFFVTGDENNMLQRSIEEFVLEPGSFVNEETRKIRKKSRALSAKLDAYYKLSNTSRIEYIGRYNAGDFNNRAFLLFNTDSINEILQTNSTFTDHRITYTKRASKRKAFQITGRYIYDDKPQEYAVDAYLYEGLFDEIDSAEKSFQNQLNSINFLGLEAIHFLDISRSNWQTILGYTYHKQSLLSDLYFEDMEQNTLTAGANFQNDLTYGLHDFYAKLKYKYTAKKLAFRSALEIHKLFSRYTSIQESTSESTSFIVPSIGLTWYLGDVNKFLLSYRYNTKSLPFNQIHDGFILTNYRSFGRGLGYFQQVKGSIFLGSYVLGDWGDAFFMNASVLYNKDHDYLSSQSDITPNYAISTPLLLKNRDFLSLNLSMDYLFEELSTNFKLKAALNKTEVENVINNSDVRSITTTMYMYGLEARSAFSDLFNFHLGVSSNSSVIKTPNRSSNLNIDAFLDLHFRFSEKFNIKIKNEQYYFGNLAEKKSFYFSDFEARYIIKKNKSDITFLIPNLWNTRTFKSFSINDTGSYSSAYDLLPRYFMLRLSYRF